MSLHICLKCDVCHEDSQTRFQSIGFDALTETYADLLQAIDGAGWRLKLEGVLPTHATCPVCVADEVTQ